MQRGSNLLTAREMKFRKHYYCSVTRVVATVTLQDLGRPWALWVEVQTVAISVGAAVPTYPKSVSPIPQPVAPALQTRTPPAMQGGRISVPVAAERGWRDVEAI